MVKRHTKPNPNAGIAGGVVEKESSIDMSNISIFNPSTKKADKVKIKSQEDGSKLGVLNLQVRKYRMIPLKEHYKTTVVPELKEKLGLNRLWLFLK